MKKIGTILSTLAMLPLAGAGFLMILLISIPLRTVRGLSRLFSRRDFWADFDVDDDSSALPNPSYGRVLMDRPYANVQKLEHQPAVTRDHLSPQEISSSSTWPGSSY